MCNLGHFEAWSISSVMRNSMQRIWQVEQDFSGIVKTERVGSREVCNSSWGDVAEKPGASKLGEKISHDTPGAITTNAFARANPRYSIANESPRLLRLFLQS